MPKREASSDAEEEPKQAKGSKTAAVSQALHCSRLTWGPTETRQKGQGLPQPAEGTPGRTADQHGR